MKAQPITPCAPDRLEHAAMRQTWKRLTFLHWPFDPALVRPLLPEGLELDTFDNAAWIGLVPFAIYNFPGLSHFPETNVRTYVVGPDGSRAVWFFSLDAARLLAVIGAEVAYGLHLSRYIDRVGHLKFVTDPDEPEQRLLSQVEHAVPCA